MCRKLTAVEESVSEVADEKLKQGFKNEGILVTI